MPTNRTKRTKKKNVVLPTSILEILSCAFTYFHEEPTESELAGYWAEHKEFIMSLIGVNIKARYPDFFYKGIAVPWGTRPWGWWEYESPQPRRLVAGDPAVIIDNGQFIFGRPRFYRTKDHGCQFESQPDYLERLGLLLPGEKEKIDLELIRF